LTDEEYLQSVAVSLAARSCEVVASIRRVCEKQVKKRKKSGGTKDREGTLSSKVHQTSSPASCAPSGGTKDQEGNPASGVHSLPGPSRSLGTSAKQVWHMALIIYEPKALISFIAKLYF